MAISNRTQYSYTLTEVPGVVVARTFLSVFNPLGSGVSHVLLSLVVSSYAMNATTATKSLIGWRVTGHSLGVVVSGVLVPRYQSNWPDPVSQLRIGGPTTVPLVGAGPALLAFPPVMAGSSGGASAVSSTSSAATFVALPGEGFAFGTVAGDEDQLWNITYIWQEIS